jgi:hypothetical protein
MMKAFLISVLVGLLSIVLVPGAAIRSQQRLIRQMATNPFCMGAR